MGVGERKRPRAKSVQWSLLEKLMKWTSNKSLQAQEEYVAHKTRRDLIITSKRFSTKYDTAGIEKLTGF